MTAKTQDLSDLKMLVTISEQENPKSEVEQKFLKYNKGIKLYGDEKNYNMVQLVGRKIEDLLYRLRQFNMVINSTEEGYHSKVAFYHSEFKENGEIELIEFTWEECREFLKLAIDKKRETPQFKKLLEKYNLAKEIGDTKTMRHLCKVLGI